MKIVIGIQARSTSTRLPGKSLKLLGGRPMISYSIDSAVRAAKFLNSGHHDVRCHVGLLVPYDDPIEKETWPCKVYTGPEHDVLTRFLLAAAQNEADYVVRLTGDCVLMQSHTISKMVNIATKNKLDYVSNVDIDMRTSADGLDCEVISAKALTWLNMNSNTPLEREHVTIKLRDKPVDGLRYGHLFYPLDQSHIKFSVDTQEEFDVVENELKKVRSKMELCRDKYGPSSVYIAG